MEKKYYGSHWYKQKQFGYSRSSKYLILCSAEEINPYKFGTTWEGKKNLISIMKNYSNIIINK